MCSQTDDLMGVSLYAEEPSSASSPSASASSSAGAAPVLPAALLFFFFFLLAFFFSPDPGATTAAAGSTGFLHTVMHCIPHTPTSQTWPPGHPWRGASMRVRGDALWSAVRKISGGAPVARVYLLDHNSIVDLHGLGRLGEAEVVGEGRACSSETAVRHACEATRPKSTDSGSGSPTSASNARLTTVRGP